MLIITIKGDTDKNVMIYGHIDKQPHMTEGWSEGLHPTKPVLRGDKAYGRGISDDGYVPFATLLAIKACKEQGVKLPRIAITLETEEESGSENLLKLLDACAEYIQTPDICICLDSGGLDYNSLWITSSLRGMVACNCKVEIMG
jgi:acetylornithine deacetylase/succinyl-diaminopimelate desuccinylase-like protein